MSNKESRKAEYDERKRIEQLQIQQYMEQQARDFENTLFSVKRVAILQFMSDRGLESLLAHVEQEIKGRAEQEAKTEDDGMTAAERFRKARE